MGTFLAWTPGPWELIVVGAVALILFGRRLPEVGRSLGKSIVEFKRGLRGIEDDFDTAGSPKDSGARSSEQKPPSDTPTT